MLRRLIIATLAACSLSGCYIADMNVFANVKGSLDKGAVTDLAGETRAAVTDAAPARTAPADTTAAPSAPKLTGWISGKVSRMSGKSYDDLTVWATKGSFTATASVKSDRSFVIRNLPELDADYRVSVTINDVNYMIKGPDGKAFLPYTTKSNKAYAPYVQGIGTSGEYNVLLIIPVVHDMLAEDGESGVTKIQ